MIGKEDGCTGQILQNKTLEMLALQIVQIDRLHFEASPAETQLFPHYTYIIISVTCFQDIKFLQLSFLLNIMYFEKFIKVNSRTILGMEGLF